VNVTLGQVPLEPEITPLTSASLSSLASFSSSPAASTLISVAVTFVPVSRAADLHVVADLEIS
jgi:hypothetical protein